MENDSPDPVDKETPRDSVFHHDNVAAYTLMTLLQMRDLAYLNNYMVANPDTSDKHREMSDQMETAHSEGRIVFPPPYVA